MIFSVIEIEKKSRGPIKTARPGPTKPNPLMYIHFSNTFCFSENYSFASAKQSRKLFFTNDEKNLENSDYFIITAPTPINKLNKPDLKSLIGATKIVGKYIKKNSIVIYESTVFPGCTEEICAPLLSKISKLRLKS